MVLKIVCFVFLLLGDVLFGFFPPICVSKFLMLRNGKPKPPSELATLIRSTPDQTLDQLRRSAATASLSEQQRRVMDKVLEGKDLAEIQSELGLSDTTVRNHYQRAVLKMSQLRPTAATPEPVPKDEGATEWLRSELIARNMVVEDLGSSPRINLIRLQALDRILAGHTTGSAFERETLKAVREALSAAPMKARETPPTRVPGEPMPAWLERENAARNWDARTLALALGSKAPEAKEIENLTKGGELADRISLHTRISIVKRLEALYAQNSPQEANLHLPNPGESLNDWFSRELTARYADTVPAVPPPELLRTLGSSEQRRVRAAFNARTFTQPPSNAIVGALGNFFRVSANRTR